MTKQITDLSAQVAEIDPTSILSEAQTNATNLITTAMGGYVLKTQNELFIMDTDDVDTAQKVWRWNVAGLGFSSTGVNGTYSIAMTNDGKIVADAITAGSMAIGKISGLQGILDGLQNSIDINQDNVQIAINGVNTINTNGVSKLVNTLVTIDTAGVNVSQTGSQVASLLANDGMTIYKDKGTANEVKLLIAGKLPDNSTGVQTDNIVVKKFLIIGGKSRMEDYGTGTGVFFIG
jgi:phage-related protein